jgi:hypothetical protein
MKKIYLLIIGAMIPIVIVGLLIVIIRFTLPKDIWSYENQHIEYESYSPNKLYKIGAYKYDEGALGYTATQVSIAKSNEQYPISGNLLRDQDIYIVNWVSDTKAEIPIGGKNEWKSKFVVSIE